MLRPTFKLTSIAILLLLSAAANRAQGVHVDCFDEKTRAPVPCSSSSSSSSSDSDSGGPIYGLLRLLFGGGRRSSANPAHSAAFVLNERGNSAYDQHDWETARMYYEKALRQASYDVVIRQNLGHAQNQLGVEAANAGDWTRAATYFREALNNDPNNSVIRKNQEFAQDTLQKQETEAAAAKSLNDGIAKLVDKLKSPSSTSSSGLDFAGGTSSSGSQGLTFMSGNAGADLKSAASAGENTRLSDSLGFIKGKESPKVFDTRGDNAGSLDPMVVDARGTNKAAEVPRAIANSPKYKKLQTQKKELQEKYADKQEKLQEVRKQQEDPSADKPKLQVEEAKIKQDMSFIQQQQIKVQYDLDHFQVGMEEETPRATSAKPQATKTQPPHQQ